MDTDEFSYENILRGLLDIKIKLSVRDSECLGMVFTPGVATPVLIFKRTSLGHTNSLTRGTLS